MVKVIFRFQCYIISHIPLSFVWDCNKLSLGKKLEKYEWTILVLYVLRNASQEIEKQVAGLKQVPISFSLVYIHILSHIFGSASSIIWLRHKNKAFVCRCSLRWIIGTYSVTLPHYSWAVAVELWALYEVQQNNWDMFSCHNLRTALSR